MSNMILDELNSKSKTAISEAVGKAIETTNKMGITDKQPNQKQKEKVIDELNYPLRKVAHASEYFIFTIIILIALKNSGIKGKRKFIIALAICFIYACTDEYHQTFVKGRTGQFTDSLIDTAGGFSSCLIYYLINKVLNKKIST